MRRTPADAVAGARVYLNHSDPTQALYVCQQGLLMEPANPQLLRLAREAATLCGDHTLAQQYADEAARVEAEEEARKQARRDALAQAGETASVAGHAAAASAGLATGVGGCMGASALGVTGAGLLAGGAAITPGCGCLLGIPMMLLGCGLLFGAAILGIAAMGSAATLTALGLGGVVAWLAKRNRH